MQLEQNIYPYNPDAKKLPFYLTGIGGSRYQGRICRKSGYQWHQILYCAQGGGTLEYDGVSVKLSEGDYFFIPKDYPHTYFPDKSIWDVRWITFDGSACLDLFKMFKMTSPEVVTPHEENSMERIFDAMFESQTEDILYCDYVCSGLVYDYIIGFRRLMSGALDSVRSRQLSMLLPVLRYMHDNFRTDFPMTVLNEMIGITPQHFCRVFKKAMNMRPGEYLIGMRIEEAKRLILENKLDIKEAALRSGFSDAGYFSTVFKKYVGVSPDRYRKNHLKKEQDNP